MKRLLPICGTFSALPGFARAHDAFGDVGPFYEALLHPLADPAQGLLLAAVAVLLARQPLAAARIAYALLACTVVAAAILLPFLAVAPPSAQLAGVVAGGVGGVALLGLSLPAALLSAICMATALVASAGMDPSSGLRDTLLSTGGSVLGICLAILFLWRATEMLQARLGPIASAVAASWIIAIGLLAVAIPSPA